MDATDEVKKTFDIKIDMLPVKSGNILRIGYDKDSQIMRVLFSNNSMYQYVDVQPEAYEQLVKSESIGKSFNFFRKMYRYVRMA
jgi:hypothetical protein